MLTEKLSLKQAILININIMMGTGIFINTVPLAHNAGMLGALAYSIIGILVLPLILSIARLVNRHPDGGFYIFGKEELGTFVGFISSWSYFTCKLASATLMIHVATQLIQTIIPAIAIVGPFNLDIFIISLFIFLNTRNLQTGRAIQSVFMILKLIPLLFVILVGIFFISGAHITSGHMLWTGIPFTIPLVLYAATGFEAIVSLSNKIINPRINAPKAILISYVVALGLATLYQAIFYGILGVGLAKLSALSAQPLLRAFPLLLLHITSYTQQNIYYLQSIFHLAIAASALGGAYGILYSNNWNLYILASHNHTFAPRLLTRLNNHSIPVACVIIEGLLCFLYLYISYGNQVALQLTTAFGVTLVYTISVIALLAARLRENPTLYTLLLPIFGLGSCGLLMAFCIRSFLIANLSSLLLFVSILIFGTLMFAYTYNKNYLK